MLRIYHFERKDIVSDISCVPNEEKRFLRFRHSMFFALT